MTEFVLNKGSMSIDGDRLIIEDDVRRRWKKNLLIGCLLCVITLAALTRIIYKPDTGFKLFTHIFFFGIYSIYTIDFIIRRVVKYSRKTEFSLNDIVKYERILGLYKESGEFKLTLRDGKTRSFTLKQEDDAKALVYLLNQHTNTAHPHTSTLSL
jgi:hypothetical protein